MTLISRRGCGRHAAMMGSSRRAALRRACPIHPFGVTRREGKTGQAERKALTSRAERPRLTKGTRYAAADEKPAPLP